MPRSIKICSGICTRDLSVGSRRNVSAGGHGRRQTRDLDFCPCSSNTVSGPKYRFCCQLPFERNAMVKFCPAWNIVFVLAAIAFDPSEAICAEEFVSEEHGFRFRVPDGFHEASDGTPMTVKMFAEDEKT